MPRAIVRASIQRPRLTLSFWVVSTLVAVLGLTQLRVETSTDSVLDRSGPEWRFYEASRDLFGGDEIITLLIPGKKPFDTGVLERIRTVSETLEDTPGVRRVDSLSTVPYVSTTPDGDLSLAPLYDESELSPESLEARVKSDRIAPSALVSEDGMAFAINVVLEAGSEALYAEILAQVELARGSRGWVSGVPVFRTESDSRIRRQLATLSPLTVAVIAALVGALFGSLRATLIPLVSSGAAAVCLLGGMGFVGAPITITTVTLPSLLLALGCAYAMHFLTAAAGALGPEQREEALLRVALPVALSGLTTAIGFGAVSFVPIDAVRDIGTFGAGGVLLVLLSTLMCVPAAATLWPIPCRGQRLSGWLETRGAEHLSTIMVRRKAPILALWLVGLVVVGIGVRHLQVETDVILWIPEDDPVRQDYAAIRDQLSGISPMNIIVESEAGESVIKAGTLTAVHALGEHLAARPEVGKVISLADPIAQLHENFAETVDTVIPNNDALIAQYVLLLESKAYIRDLLTADHTSTNLMLRIDDNASGALLEVARSAEEWWGEHGPPGTRATTTGIMHEFARAEDAMTYGQIRGLVFSIGVVALVLLATLRSPGLALAALVPNAVPIAMAFGVMGLLSIPLDAGTVLVGNLALGIAVDDTLHLAVGYQRGLEEGLTAPEAWRRALIEVLPALVYTTLAVALGFAVLAVSDFAPVRNLGVLTACVMVACLVADLLLFPVLLVLRERLPETQKAH